MIYPILSEYQELIKEYSVIPVVKEIPGDIDTPITLFNKLCKDQVSFLLESVEVGNKWGRYSFIGRKPHLTIKGSDNKLFLENKDGVEVISGKYLDCLRDIFKKYQMPKNDGLPDFVGGGVGYIAYDVIRDYERLLLVNEDNMELPDIHLLVMEEIIVYDHMRQKILIIINDFVKDNNNSYEQSIQRIDKVEEEIHSAKVYFKKGVVQQSSSYISNETKSSYMEKVEKAKDYIRKGDIFQVVLSQRLEIETNTDPLEFYRLLRSLNPSPYMYYFEFMDYQVVGSSPELLVKLKDNNIETCPIAGTRPRGNDNVEDDKFADDLLNDEKEKAEHLMLLDLARNDIGKLSEFGSVELTHFMEVQRYSHVMHIVSNVIGKLHSKYDMFDVLISSLPAGTVSGAPKVRAMEIIDELENKKRGIYAGSIGYFGFNGNMDMCITIRTVIFHNNKAVLQAGAGIVADSIPESEYEETLKKAGAMLEALKLGGI
ncbi:anthranilate synthase component I [Alkalibaculum sp. M08DMB]|uniref:Anthranilate synthase component 1 n=1 Tax=Alkalibaculum sporogenes TaxID=2655001 RepID=A0A6A7KBD8_9FIRM|nr:anthranilate synthase component I [Alkalibaculum sporogenes]MPW26716.1 anthranilate synthase component I [Alkalibaculum sporogenes]